MNEEKPSEAKVDGRPFDGGLGPTAQAAQGVPIGRPQLSAQQIHGEDGRPSWQAPREGGVSTAGWIAVVVAAGAAVLLAFWATGVI